MTNHDGRVKSAAATCVASLASRYALLVSTVEVEYLIQLSLRQIHTTPDSTSFALLIATVASSVLDPLIVLKDQPKLRKPTRDELLAYLKLSFITGAPVAKRELITKNVSSRLVKQGVAQAHVELVRRMRGEWLEANLTLFIAHTLSLLLDPRQAAATHQDGLHAVDSVVSIFTATLDQVSTPGVNLKNSVP